METEGNDDYRGSDSRSDIGGEVDGERYIWHSRLSAEVRESDSRRSSGSASMDISDDDGGWDMEEAASTNDNES